MIVPFDQIIEAVEAGEWQGKPVQAGLVIHEGQLTYGDRGLRLAVDLGAWWYEQTGLPLPLGRQRDSQGFGAGSDPRSEPVAAREHPLRLGPPRGGARSMRCNMAAIWTTPGPIGLSGCM